MALKRLSPQEEIDLIWMLEQAELERVSPKMAAFEQDAMIKIARGGRAAGAKSWSTAKTILKKAQTGYYPIIGLREIQKTLDESVKKLMEDMIVLMRYPHWKIREEYLENTKTGSYMIFRGLKDITASRNIKGLEGFKIFWADEASSISNDSWMMLLPTIFRTDGAELYITYNMENDLDPVTDRIWNAEHESIIRVECMPGKIDNPWFNDQLVKLMEADYIRDPDEAEHVWGGQPRKQGANAVMSRVLVKQAMIRKILASGGKSVGVDPADYGDDKTQIYVREGLKIIGHKELKHVINEKDPNSSIAGLEIANAVYDLIKGDPSIPIKIDTTGIGTSARDFLKLKGLKVIPLNFAQHATDEKKYANLITQIWYNFKDNFLNEVELPNDPELLTDLSDRLYTYTKDNRLIIEEKKYFKERHKRSPDKGDAVLLTFFEGATIKMSEERKQQMKSRRLRGR